MPTIAIVGAGPGLGLSIAKVFGGRGFSVALVARDQGRLDDLAGQLRAAGIDAAGFTADIMDRPSLAAAFTRIKDRFGAVDVLEYSPAPHNPVPGITMAGPLEATVENLQPQIDYYLYGGLTAAQQVLPDMIKNDAGTLLFTTGGSSADPLTGPPEFAATAVGSAALRAWVLKLHQTLAGTGVYAAHVPLNVWIGSGGPETQADTIAQHYWDVYTRRDGAEHHYTA
ncbi:SDR family NAD(P)-dependent oxidoreductase [Actinoplanes couchii]|uniref:Short-chain dehydrogenase n=1 Tax=Actinoplanes couchii TaxID=403638 RepID=A0ABQ3XRS8_9ACTN|nr:SDR family NAD(P)-dependent oxidoreductase [Actinoplanes couchii]MDR6318447.1 NADP-dependent 3-hydroxy acid dehydrogenase YdfG [Actinoplanes couchii]GID61204.1 short-chain dehydrogenase [Actinoplanes couchii]